MRLISGIYAMGEPTPPPAEERERVRNDLRRAAWHSLGLAIIDPTDVSDDWLAQAVTNEANRQFGRRGKNGG